MKPDDGLQLIEKVQHLLERLSKETSNFTVDQSGIVRQLRDTDAQDHDVLVLILSVNQTADY